MTYFSLFSSQTWFCYCILKIVYLVGRLFWNYAEADSNSFNNKNSCNLTDIRFSKILKKWFMITWELIYTPLIMYYGYVNQIQLINDKTEHFLNKTFFGELNKY